MTTFAVRVDHVEVRRDRIVADVVVSEERFAQTTAGLVARLLPRYPSLLEHCCVNDRGSTFAAVAANTSTPHLLEHMVIENQVYSGGHAFAGRRRVPCRDGGGGAASTYVGKTRWADRAARCARIELSYVDDLTALAALRDAVRDLDEALRAIALSG